MDLNRSPSGSLAKPVEPAELDNDLHKWYEELCDSLEKTFDSEDFTYWLRAIEYAPFDVLGIRKKIEKIITDNELKFLIKVFLIDKLPRKDQGKYQVLTKKLNIKKKAKRSNQEITLFRIAQSFPDVVAIMLDQDPNIAGLITLEQMRLHSEYPELPALAIQPLLACLLPRDHTESENILNVFFFSNMMLSEIFYKKSEVWGNKTKLQRATDIHTKQRNHFQSKIFNEDLRKEWCTRLKIMVDNEYSTVWIEAATKTKAKLMETYGISY